MQFLGNVLQQVPLFGTWFNALSGLSREAVIGIGSAAETLFRVMLKCVTGNLLDAFFMAIVAELLRGAFHPRSMSEGQCASGHRCLRTRRLASVYAAPDPI